MKITTAKNLWSNNVNIVGDGAEALAFLRQSGNYADTRHLTSKDFWLTVVRLPKE